RLAAQRAIDAGFEGVELHAGSGLLHHQFLDPSANHRTDEYGGSARNRCRIILETVEALVSVRGPGRVGVKIAPNFAYNGINMRHEDVLETLSVLGGELSPFGLAYLHVQYPPWGLFFG